MPSLTQFFRKSFSNRYFLKSLFNAIIPSYNKNKKNCENGKSHDLLKVNENEQNNKNRENVKKSPENPTATPHAVKDPPENYSPTEFSNKSFVPREQFNMNIFRPLKDDECLGPGATKSGDYKNPEYYSYHRYSNVDIFIDGMKFRKAGPTVCIKCTDEALEKEQNANDSEPCTVGENKAVGDSKEKLKQQCKDEYTNVDKDAKSKSNKGWDDKLICNVILSTPREEDKQSNQKHLGFSSLFKKKANEKNKEIKNTSKIDIIESWLSSEAGKLYENIKDNNNINNDNTNATSEENYDNHSQNTDFVYHTKVIPNLTIYVPGAEIHNIEDHHEESCSQNVQQLETDDSGDKLIRKVILELVKIEDENVDEHCLNLDSRCEAVETPEASKTSADSSHKGKTLYYAEELHKRSTEIISESFAKSGSGTGAGDNNPTDYK